MTVKDRTQEEKNINKIVLLGFTVIIALVSILLVYVLVRLQVKEFKTHLDTFKNTLVQREKFTIRSVVQNLKEDILYEQNVEIKKIKQVIKNQTEIAKKLAQLIYSENRDKKRETVLNKVKKAIKNISIKKENINYFIFDKNGTFLLNTQYGKFEGKNFLDFRDLNGRLFVKEIIQKAKTDDSFVKFLWYVPNSSKIKEKITYAKYIENLDIVIGSSRYLESDNLATKYLLDKLNNRKFGLDEFAFVYKIGSLNDIKKSSVLLFEKGIECSEDTLKIVENILKKSSYGGDIFFETKERLIYSLFLRNQRVFISFGIDLNRINEIIANETKISNKNLNQKILSLVLIIILITLVFFILSYFVAQKIEKVFKNYRLKVLDNERKYQLLFNHSNDGFIISEIMDKKALVIDTNDLAKRLSGYGMELIGKNFFSLFKDFKGELLFERNEFLGRAVLVTKDGKERNIELSCVLYSDNGKKILFASLRDITERIELKKEKDKQEKLLIQKSKMASMGEMIGNIAHQWRQPISQLSGLFFDIESAYDYGELDKRYLTKRIDEANDLIEYMSKTIDDFKEFYNPNTKKEIFDLKENITKTVGIIDSSLKYHNIDISIDIKEKLSIKGYSNEFSQVLLNILSNAKETALIRDIKNPHIKVYSEVTDKKIQLHIEDNCGGIEDEILDRIFEPYFTTKYNYGTGIGLYMSRIIIENKMRGKISAENHFNGARFTIELVMD